VARETPESAARHWSTGLLGFAAIALSTLGFTVVYVVFPLELERQLGMARHQAALFFVLLGLVSALVQGWLIGRLVERFGERRLIAGGSWVLALGFLAMPSAFAAGQSAAAAIAAGMVAVAVGSGVISPSATAYVSRLAPAAEQGRTLGLLLSVAAVARIIGPVMAGALATVGGARLAFYGAGACAILSGLSPMVLGSDPGADAGVPPVRT
jgi:MFS family permease